MSALDVIQVFGFAFIAAVNVWSIRVSRERRRLTRQLKALKEQP